MAQILMNRRCLERCIASRVTGFDNYLTLSPKPGARPAGLFDLLMQPGLFIAFDSSHVANVKTTGKHIFCLEKTDIEGEKSCFTHVLPYEPSAGIQKDVLSVHR